MSLIKNRMETYTKTFKGSVTGKVEVKSVQKKDNVITVVYSRDMDLSTITEQANYILYNGKGTATDLRAVKAEIEVDFYGKGVKITLPKEKEEDFKSILFTSGIKDVDGNRLNNFGKAIPFEGEGSLDLKVVAESATLSDKKSVEVKFNSEIVSADKEKFVIADNTVTSVAIEGKVVKLALDKEIYSLDKVEVKKDAVEDEFEAKNLESKIVEKIEDKVKPEIALDSNKNELVKASGKQITVEFTEEVVVNNNYADKGISVELDGKKIKIEKVEAEGKVLTITLENEVKEGSKVIVEVASDSTVTDKAANRFEGQAIYDVEFTAVKPGEETKTENEVTEETEEIK